MPSYETFARQFSQILEQSDRVLLTITTDPDGDSLGSMLAMSHAIEQTGRVSICYSPDPIPAMFSYLQGVKPIMRDLPESVHAYPLIIIFDTGDIRRTPLVGEFVKRDPNKTLVMNIDHHPTVTDWQGQSAVDHNFIDTSAAATTEMVYKLLNAMKLPINRPAATGLLTGILTDTSNFVNLNTSPESLDIAAQLMARGARHHAITEATMRNKSLGTLKLWGRALARLKIHQPSGIVSTILTHQDFQECGVDTKATTGISNFLNSLGEGTMAMVLHEEPHGIIKGSLRTTTPGVNVADFAAQFGGGGHAKAAGFKINGQLVSTKTGWRVEPVNLAKPEEF